MKPITLPRLCICLAVVSMLIQLPGCATQVQTVRAPRPTMTLHAVGYGTVRPDKGYTINQMKLMAMRASRMDAYRNLTEQVYGMQIAGTTTVSAMLVDNDSYKGFINGYLHGAKLISQQPLGNNYTYETVMELTVDDDFYEFSSRVLAASASAANAPPIAVHGDGDRHYYNSH